MTPYSALARFYDGLTKDIPSDKWAAFIEKQAGGLKGKRVLDAACGTGKITVQLAKRGAQVAGFDASQEMLWAADAALKQAGVAATLFTGRLESFSAHTADIITCCNDGVNYLLKPADVKGFFACAQKVLAPGGLLIFDVSSPGKLTGMANQLFFEETDALSYFWQNSFSEKTGVLTMDITLFEGQEGGLYTRREERHRQRAHQKEELEGHLSQAGFAPFAWYAGYTTKKDPDWYKTSRVTCVAKKSGT